MPVPRPPLVLSAAVAPVVVAASLAGSLVGSLGAAAPASAATTVDCAAGPVVLGGVDQQFTLVGACTDVTVTGTGHTVALESAANLFVQASSTTITASGALGKVDLSGSGLTLTAPQAGRVALGGSNGTLRVDRATTYVVQGAGASVEGTSARSLKLTGSSGRVAFRTLKVLRIKGAGNKAVVKAGRTKVSVSGASNVVRVNKRA
ncbi:DUF3060 domain-containing protein [Nocardioides flavescens]|uniref:DUF3060 domain-containing protein n=1 Tax=Nocardioides flavescens TaxID=2691959 RepID=A0A6L7F4G4_9ACTN|nr:DUF3060 domain-containing protein [Nocardioides flavescens]MXG92120.1 DUF3060 domain-containing protein [Nocardioides flavescens]